MQFSKVDIHKHFGGKYFLHIVPHTLHPKDSNLHTRHHKTSPPHVVSSKKLQKQQKEKQQKQQ
jgi:hypothetical protein